MMNSEVLEGSGTCDAGVISSNEGSMESSRSLKEIENPGNELMEGLDSFLQDINDRLTISRMVSDSVIKGMVNAVTEEANEKIAMKEMEVESLKERLHCYESGANKNEEVRISTMWTGHERTKFWLHSSLTDIGVEQNNRESCLLNLRVASEEQFHRLKKEIEDIKGGISSVRMDSSSGLLGLNGILPGKASEKWAGVDKTLDTLKNMLKTVYEQVDEMVYSSKSLLVEWQSDQDLQNELEAMVVGSIVRSLQEEFETKLWVQRAQFFDSQNINRVAKINELTSLRQELDAISRSLSSSDGSHEGGEESNNARRKDPFHRKLLNNHVSSLTSIREGNGVHEESKNIVPEIVDSSQLKHMPKDDLISYIKNEMTEMKRNYEIEVHEITEEYFSLRREFYKERGVSSLMRKDKEFDTLRRKIPEVISKVDDILGENEKIQMIYDDCKELQGLKGKLEALHSENNQLRELLTKKRKEIKCLSSQVSDAADKMSNHSLAEANLLKQIIKLKCDAEDARIEVSIREEVFQCILREVIDKVKVNCDTLDLESMIMQEICGIFFREAIKDAEASIKCGIIDSDMESILMQEMCEIVFREAVKDAVATNNLLVMKIEEESEMRVSFEARALESEKVICAEMKEKEQLKQEILSLKRLIEEKEKLALEAASVLMEEEERFELVCEELNMLKDNAGQLELLISKSSQESDCLKSNLEEASEQICMYQMEISELNKKLNLAIKELSEADEERKSLHAIIQEKENTLSSAKEKESEHRTQMESIILSVQRLSKAAVDFECRIAENVRRNNQRIELLSTQCIPLSQKANSLRKMGLVFKQSLERRYSDLQKAEAEVDLLGDEVDALLNLLEKIYIALDHYSPILQHYPGIMEILKLVRRELSAEASKSV